tara:strand:+ start:1395 stop:2504 length:1110 start_codon:yes stop_codon:yes gene_type:complete
MALQNDAEDKLIISKSGAGVTNTTLDAIFIAGLTTVIPLDKQKEKLKAGFGEKKVLKSFKHDDPINTITTYIKNHPDVYIFLYSAGCTLSKAVSSTSGVNLNKVYIVEPYSPSTADNSVRTANQNGVPLKNIFLGPVAARGKGILSGTSKTPDGLNHGESLIHAAKAAANDAVSTPPPPLSPPTPQSLTPTPIPSPLSSPSIPTKTTSIEPTNNDVNGKETGAYANLSNGWCIIAYKDGIRKITVVRDGAGNLIRTDYYNNTTDKDAVSFTLTKLNDSTAITPNQSQPSKVKSTEVAPNTQNNVEIGKTIREDELETPDDNDNSEYVYEVYIEIIKNSLGSVVSGKGRGLDTDTAIKNATENAKKNAYL